MSNDFKENVIQLMQHPAMYKPLEELSNEELQKAYDLSCDLDDLLGDEEYTLLDYIQMARIRFFLGLLAYNLSEGEEKVYSCFKSGFLFLEKGGIDLSINKWAELISLRTSD